MHKTFLQALLVLMVAGVVAHVASGADMSFVTNPDGGAQIPLVLTASNGASAVSTSLTAPAQYSIQCTNPDAGSATARYRACSTSTCAAGTSDFIVPSAGMDLPLTVDTSSPPQYAKFISVYADGANIVCNVFRVVPPTLPGF